MEKRIHSAYRGEIYGISFFTHFANNYTNKSLIALWHSLIQVERLTADLLEISLNKNNIEYDRNDSLMNAKGIKDASAWINLPWSELVDTLINWVEPYERQYRLWVIETTQEFETFQLIADHETAIFQCWKSEQIGESGIPKLQAFIAKYTDKL
ncbi:hypothetical protein [Moritella sp. 28]|uniref:hypothetical protein n=1 Tax=Moritella sp. 28 TaxID=2746232 RepID=UPI001BA6FC8D|nr:hypothetical protein [Moritella sp. 28]QUM86099.1 hypothetical protein HWV02_17075 [Moritella sp. 28]